MITFCPKCGTKLGGDESVVGKQVQCGKCGNRFTAIPADLPSSRDVPEEKFPEPPPAPSSPLEPTGGAKQPVRAAGSEKADEPTTEGPTAAPPVPATAETPKPKPAIKKAETASEGGKCPKCNAELLPNAVLCTKCGTFLKPTDAAAKKKSPLMAILIAVTALCVGAGGWVWYNSNKQSAEETPPPAPTQPPKPKAPPVASGATPTAPPRAASTPGKVDLTPLSSQDIEAVSKLPTQDPAPAPGEPAEAAKPHPLIPQPTLLQTVSFKPPTRDRYQVDKPPQLAANTRVITLRFLLRPMDIDQPITLGADTLKVSTDRGAGLFYGIEFTNVLAATTWLPRGASADSSSIIETARYANRRVADLITEKLASDDLLTRAEYKNWFERTAGAMRSDTVLVVSALNQFLGANNRVESESGTFYALQPQLNVHLVVPTTASLVKLHYADLRPMAFPVEAIATIPTTSQPDPLPFINATLEKARVLLASSAPEDVIAGAGLLIEAGNLDMQNKLKPTSFKDWAHSVTQLLVHAEVDCRAAAADAILRSQHVEIKLRTELFLTAVKDNTHAVRRRTAELLGEKPSLLDKVYKEGMQGLQALLVDSNFTVRVAAHLSNCRIAVQGDENTFEGQVEFIQKGLMDPAPSVRLALIESMLPMQVEDAKQATPRLAQLVKYVRLNLFDSSEPIRAAAARTIMGTRSPVSATIVSDALQQIPDKTATLFAQAALELPIGTATDLSFHVPALAEKQTQTLLLPTLAKLLDDPKPRTRQAAARVIGAFHAEVADPVLAAAVTNSDVGVRLSVFSSFNAPGREVLPPVSVFADGLNDPDQRIRGAAFSMLDQVMTNPAVVASVSSNIETKVASATIRLAVAQKFAAPAVTNEAMLFATTSFLTDTDDNVWRAAITPWAKTKLQLSWNEVAPVWNLLLQQSKPARRLGAFYLLRLAAGEAPESASAATMLPPPEAIEEASKLLGDPDTNVREAALVFLVPHRRDADTEAIRKILTDPKVDLSGSVRNQVLVALAKPSTAEKLEVVDRIRPATEEDKKKDREALNAAATATPSRPGEPKAPSPPKPPGPPAMPMPPGPGGPGAPPMPPGMTLPQGAAAPPGPPGVPPQPPQPKPTPAPAPAPGGGSPRVAYVPISYKVMVPATSRTGMYLLTAWATSQNPSAGAAAGYLMQLVQPMYSRSWLLPSERASIVQALRKLTEVPAVAANAKMTLSTFEARFPFGVAAKSLASDQTQGAAENVDALMNFLAPKRKPMIIATYKAPSGNLIDIWLNADETPPPSYPPDAPKDSGPAWKFLSKLEGSRMEPIDRETLARLEWAVANAPKEKVREALLKLAKAEGDVGPMSHTVALEGLLLLAAQGDPEAEAEAVKMGWLKL